MRNNIIFIIYSFSVLFGQKVTFTSSSINSDPGPDGTWSVAVGDLDNDGDLDLAVGSWVDNSIYWERINLIHQ